MKLVRVLAWICLVLGCVAIAIAEPCDPQALNLQGR